MEIRPMVTKEQAKYRIRMMEENLSKSKKRLVDGEITKEYYKILQRDVKNATKIYKKVIKND
jgi:hypothetical protein